MRSYWASHISRHLDYRKAALWCCRLVVATNLNDTYVANCDQVCNLMQVQGLLKLSISWGYWTNMQFYVSLTCKSNIFLQNLIHPWHCFFGGTLAWNPGVQVTPHAGWQSVHLRTRIPEDESAGDHVVTCRLVLMMLWCWPFHAFSWAYHVLEFDPH